MGLLRHLLFTAAQRAFTLEVRYVQTHNGPADALSRGDVPRFRRLHPEAESEPDLVPLAVNEYLRSPEDGPRLMTGLTL